MVSWEGRGSQTDKHLPQSPFTIYSSIILDNDIWLYFLSGLTFIRWKKFRTVIKGSDHRENRGVGNNINTRYLVWRCDDGRSFAL